MAKQRFPGFPLGLLHFLNDLSKFEKYGVKCLR